MIIIPSYRYSPLPHTGTAQHWPGRCWSGAPRSCWTCPAPPPYPPLGKRAGVGILWAEIWNIEDKKYDNPGKDEPVELLLVLVPLDAVQGLPLQVILAPQGHRLVHLKICWSDLGGQASYWIARQKHHPNPNFFLQKDVGLKMSVSGMCYFFIRFFSVLNYYLLRPWWTNLNFQTIGKSVIRSF